MYVFVRQREISEDLGTEICWSLLLHNYSIILFHKWNYSIPQVNLWNKKYSSFYVYFFLIKIQIVQDFHNGNVIVT